ncbi:MAG: HxsD-like protein [Candidatus Paceibacterota bacterium]|jgi:hypothetical protein|nr:HxsD-like protein [Candidatus Paceibacterota bacterium]
MTIIFDKKLYKLSAVKRAADAFCELAEFKIEDKGKAYVVTAKKLDEEAGLLLDDEFANYVLAEMRNE